jgi:cytoskeletal protein RodZ
LVSISFDLEPSIAYGMERVAACEKESCERGRVAAFGEELRRAREERGVSFEAICAVTKVPPKHIRALETGALAELPGGVFRRGFLRSYLGALGLEEEAWMRRFEESCRESGMADPGGMEWVTFAENVKNNRVVMGRAAGMKRAGIGLLILVLALAGWCGWRLVTHRRLVPSPMIWTGLKSLVDNRPPR